MADPVLLASGTAATSSVNVSFSAQPAGTLLLLFVAADDYDASLPSGWTLARGQESNVGHYVWYKFATGAETSVTYTIGSATGSWYALISKDGIDSGTAPIVNSQSTLSSGTAYTTGAITPTAGSSWVVFGSIAGVHYGGYTATSLASWLNSYTEVADVAGDNSSSANVTLGVAWRDSFAGGSSTSTGATRSMTAECMSGLIVAFKVASGGSNDGTLSASVPKLTSSMSGGSVNAGTLSAAPPNVAGSVTGASVNTGTMSAQAPKLTSSISEQSSVSGTLAGSVPVVAASGSGASVNSGTMNAQTPKATAAISGQSVNAGSLSAPAPVVTATITGTATLTGTLSAAVPRVTTSISDTTTNPGTLAASLPHAAASLAGASVNAGALAVSIPLATATIAGQLVVPGTFTPTLPLSTVTLTGVQSNLGVLACGLPLVRFSVAPQGGYPPVPTDRPLTGGLRQTLEGGTVHTLTGGLALTLTQPKEH